MGHDEEIKAIGSKIRALRCRRGITIQELSDMLGIEYNNLIRIEKGRTNFTVKTLLSIADALSATLVELVDTSDEKEA